MTRFTLRQIEYFIAAGETGSITLAAQRISISAPSISTAISHLEIELGTKLFVRHHAHGVTLTAAGRALLVEAKRLIGQVEQLSIIASEVSGTVRGQITVGCMVTLAPMVMPELSHSFTAAYPLATVEHLVSDHERLMRALANAEIDVALTYNLGQAPGTEFSPLASLPPYVVVSETHPLAERRSVTLSELAEENLILLDLPASRDYFLALFMKEGLQPHIGFRSAYPDVIRTMVANSYGYSIYNVRPRTSIALDGRRLVQVPLAGVHLPVVMGIARRTEEMQPLLLQAFVNHCEQTISNFHIPGMLAPGLDEPGPSRTKP